MVLQVDPTVPACEGTESLASEAARRRLVCCTR
jgi:hypothetical protein